MLFFLKTNHFFRFERQIQTLKKFLLIFKDCCIIICHMKNTNQNTIAVISTPLSSGAISVVRMSGSEAVQIADKVFKTKSGKTPSSFTPRMMTFGTFDAKDFKEKALCVVFKAPNSFTGEDIVEFQCHGGVTLTKGILATLIENGARLALPGEFTKRAFVNGKMALSDAEGMMDMINAESEAEIRAGYNLLSGELSKTAFSAQKELVDILSEIEVSFDYPEETILYITKSNAKNRLEEISRTLEKVLKTASAGKMIKNGVNVAIVGKPNVGKSSLLNKLVMDEKAIVTPIAGTTRDVIESQLIINGLKFNLYDTAGIHNTEDQIEKIGVDKAKNIIKGADIVLFVKDSDSHDDEDDEVEELLKKHKHLIIVNKCDKLKTFKDSEDTIHVSALKGENIEKISEKLYALACQDKAMQAGLMVASERHISALKSAKENIDSALQEIDNFTLDLITIDLNLAYQALGEITGSTTSEEIIDAIFSKFCLGK